MIEGREEIYFGHQFTSKAGKPGAIPQDAVDVYVDLLRDPTARHTIFEYYRTLDEWPAQVQRWRDEGPLDIPVLAIGGEYATGTGPEQVMHLLATDVTGLVIPGIGHFLAEEAPEALTKASLDFPRWPASPGRTGLTYSLPGTRSLTSS